MKKIREIGTILIKFFPIQLLILQLKKSHFIFAVWLIFFALITQNLGSKYGIPYLFLAPEYLGEVNWLSYFILGFSIGGFFMAYHLYTYIILGPSFPFLVTLARPFYKFSINNSTFPILFYFLLIYNIYQVQCNEEFVSIGHFLVEILALTGGIVIFIIFSVLYFFKTNLDIIKLKGKESSKKRSLYSTVNTLFSRKNYWFKSSPNATLQASYYFSSLGRIARVRPSDHYDRKMVREIFRQNHLNASFFEIMMVFSFLVMGILQDFIVVIIPSGASFFLLCTMLLMVVTIFYSWFKAWALSVLFLTLILINVISKTTGFLQSDNHAYGLTYENKAPYNLQALKDQQFDEVELKKEVLHHEKILDNWKVNASIAQKTDKPKLVIVNCSGGGLRAAMWTHFILQEVDERTQGSFMESTHLMTGASGGMIGAAYFRSIYASTSFEERLTKKETYLNNISKDLLNNVAFNLVAHDLFLRYRKFEFEGQTYLKDRGYAFEQELNHNTEFLMDGQLKDFISPEYTSKIPLMVFSPTIINDGRRLIIGAQPYSFLNGVNFENKGIGPENVEFSKLFKNNNAMNVKFTSVMRMSSTFPYILPMVSLPTSPEIHLMDAGIRDNYGTKTTVRYIVALKKWLKENTSGIVIVEIRDVNKDYDFVDNGKFSLYDRMTKPASNFYGNFYQTQEFNAIELIENLNADDLNIELVSFLLRKDPTEKIALSWHLTQREKNDIKRSFQSETNQRELTKLLQLINPRIQ